MVAVGLLALTAARAEAGGPDYWINSALVHQVETDGSKIVFTVSGPCAIYIQDPAREDKGNRVETALKRCVIMITKEAFEKSGERTLMSWSDCQASAKGLAGKTAFMQLAGTATLAGNRIRSIHASGTCYFRAEQKSSGTDCLPCDQDALKLVKKLGGTVTLDEAGHIIAVLLWNGARGWSGIQRTKVTDGDLEKLQGLTTLKELDLEGAQITDDGLRYLRDMKTLRRLRLDQTKITDAGLKDLAGLTNLEELLIWNTQITDAGLVHLSRLTNLQALWIDATKITDNGLVHLKDLANLRTLFMQGTNVTDAGLRHLWGLKKLERVLLHQTQCTPEGLNELAKHLPHFGAYEVNTRKVSAR
jgi:hypothetical protein